jgi:hypothetical protein
MQPRLMALLVALAACGDKVCTAAGCYTGLTVHLASKPTQPYRVEVSTDGGPTPYTVYVYDCPNPQACTQDPTFPAFIPERLSVRITVGAASRLDESVRPNWATAQPNGPTCPPTCRQATITVALPTVAD